MGKVKAYIGGIFCPFCKMGMGHVYKLNGDVALECVKTDCENYGIRYLLPTVELEKADE